MLRASVAAERIARSLQRGESAESQRESLILALVGSQPLARKEAATRLLETGLIEPLEAFLAGAGDIKQTSASLSVHRGTVYYRLRKVAALTGLSPHCGADRLTLQVGLHIARLQNPA